MFMLLLTTALTGLTLSILIAVFAKCRSFIALAVLCALLAAPCMMDLPHIIMGDTAIIAQIKNTSALNSICITKTDCGSFFSVMRPGAEGEIRRVIYAPHTRLIIRSAKIK